MVVNIGAYFVVTRNIFTANMCSTDFGMLDLLFEKEDPSCKGLSDGFKNTLFSSSEALHDGDIEVKEEVLDSGTIDWKMVSQLYSCHVVCSTHSFY